MMTALAPEVRPFSDGEPTTLARSIVRIYCRPMPRRTPARTDDIARVAALMNLGPKSAGWMVAAGITSLARLRRLGPVAAWLKVRAVEPRASLVMLWALAGAAEGRHWNRLAPGTRESLLMELDARGVVVGKRSPRPRASRRTR